MFAPITVFFVLTSTVYNTLLAGAVPSGAGVLLLGAGMRTVQLPGWHFGCLAGFPGLKAARAPENSLPAVS
jgi:hypothetical protein